MRGAVRPRTRSLDPQRPGWTVARTGLDPGRDAGAAEEHRELRPRARDEVVPLRGQDLDPTGIQVLVLGAEANEEEEGRAAGPRSRPPPGTRGRPRGAGVGAAVTRPAATAGTDHTGAREPVPLRSV